MILEHNGISIEIVRKKIKNVHLRIYPPDGLVKISAPVQFSDLLIQKLLEEKSAWIQQQREKILNRPAQEPFTPKTGARVLFQGKSYLFIMEEHQGPASIKIKDELMYCFIQPNSSHAQIQALLDYWYKMQMYSILPDLFSKWESIIGVKAAQWGIKKMKTRWGSCNTRAARIWLNLNLIQKPTVCLEYVLVHELVHLLEPSHNKRFYQFMNKFMPNWREYQHLLEGRAL